MEIQYIDASRKVEIEQFLKEWFNDDVYITAKTSGSTGIPKEIKIQKKHLIHSAKNTIKYFNLNQGSHLFLCLSTDTIAGKMMLIRAITVDGKISIGSVKRNTMDDLPKQVDFVALVPIQLEHYLKQKEPINVNTIIVGGAPISDTLRDLCQTVSSPIYQTFGMTETLSHVAVKCINGETNNNYEALEGIHFSTQGEQLIIHYPGIGHDALLSNDIVELIDPFHFNWLGRADFAINSGGIKLFPEQIEQKLSGFLPCPFFISSIKEESLGESICLYIASEKHLDIKKEVLLKLLSKFEVPRYFKIGAPFTYTHNGKIDRLGTIKNYSSYEWRKVL